MEGKGIEMRKGKTKEVITRGKKCDNKIGGKGETQKL